MYILGEKNFYKVYSKTILVVTIVTIVVINALSRVNYCKLLDLISLQ